MADDMIERIRTEFPAFASLVDIPDILWILTQAVNEGWDIGKLQANLYATPWWQSQSEAQRNAAILYRTDPGSYNRQLAQIRQQVADEAARLGAKLTHDEWIMTATRAMNEGWSTTEITRAILDYSSKRDTSSGALRATTSEIFALSRSYGMGIATKWAADQARKIAAGTQTIEGVRNYFHEQALWKYAAAGNEQMVAGLQKGNTVWDVLQPTLSILAEELELPMETLDLTKGIGAKLANYKDPDTGTLRVMTQTEALQTARADPRWRKGNRGKAIVSEAIDGISRFMGARA